MSGMRLYTKVIFLCLCCIVGNVSQLSSEGVSIPDEFAGPPKVFSSCETSPELPLIHRFGEEPANDDSAVGSWSIGNCSGAPVDC